MSIPFRNLTPFAHVRSVARSIEFYERLGFTVGNTVGRKEDPGWAWLQSGGAALMVALADEPVIASQQAVLFYLYVPDTAAKHAELKSGGIAVGDITFAPHARRGEFRVEDPDGYVLMVTHT